jgi:hypothetical protein
MCEGISGTIGNLEIDATYQEQESDIPIDALVLDLARIDDKGGDSEAQSQPFGKGCFFAHQVSIFRRLFGCVNFELAYTLHISICSSVYALSFDV